jgi:2-iminobutanoate/2-iminopropanoate deaminase
MLKQHAPPNVYPPIGPYAQAVEAVGPCRILFISGTMGLFPDGQLAGDFEQQAHAAWANVMKSLGAAGMDSAHLAKVTIWMARREDWQAGARIRQQYLGEHKPAMSVVQVGLVDPAWLIEVEAIAIEGGPAQSSL